MPNLVRPVNLRKPIVNRKLIAWVFIVTGILSVILWLVGQKNKGVWTLFKPTTITFELKPQKLPVVPADTSVADAKIVTQLQDMIAQLDGDFSVYVYRPSINVGYGIAPDKILPAASIIKVPIMIAVLKKAEAGIISLDDNYALQDADRREGGPIEGMAAGTNLTLRYILQQMGQASDNSAPAIFENLVGADYIQTTIKTLGMDNTSFSQNTTTAADLNQMWRSVYGGHYLNASSTALMEQDLSNSIYEDRIPAGLPVNTKTIHKVGSAEHVWTDTAVITSPTGKIIYLTILNDGVSLGETQTAFPDLVKIIWNYESLQ